MSIIRSLRNELYPLILCDKIIVSSLTIWNFIALKI